jgi:light-regulated signal transduction histidine kinase (bacteriophytochrome)
MTERRRAENEIRQLNADLERRVAARTEQLAASNKELEAFSYSVSHDLRAPLRAIDGFSKALLEDAGDSLDAAGRCHLERVRTATRRMGHLIDDLLDLARLSRAEMRREAVDLGEIGREIAESLRQAQPERDVEFVIGEDLTVVGDSKLLRVVLDNLLRNSWKFTSKHPSARIELGRSAQNGCPVYFVADDGAGFDMDHAKLLFAPFQRLHRQTDFEGTGVGLATVQRIIHRHGGKIWGEGSIEKGATFYFTLSEESS